MDSRPAQVHDLLVKTTVRRKAPPMLRQINPAIWVVMFCAAMWGFWWYPVALFESAGLEGPWIGFAMNVAAMPVALIWCLVRPGAVSSRAVLGCLFVGLAVTLYAVAASYTDFIRAVLLFYLAPAWSTLIEIFFFGRRWSLQSIFAIAFSLGGVLLISRGEISFDGLGALGDWMALGSGLAWSIGIALAFSSRQATANRVMLITVLGGALSAFLIALADGTFASTGWPDWPGIATTTPWAFVFSAIYVGIILAGTMWGAFQLPPAVMSYLLSIEILGGVLSSALILGEVFGLYETGGAILIISAVLIEVMWTPRIAKTGSSA